MTPDYILLGVSDALNKSNGPVYYLRGNRLCRVDDWCFKPSNDKGFFSLQNGVLVDATKVNLTHLFCRCYSDEEIAKRSRQTEA